MPAVNVSLVDDGLALGMRRGRIALTATVLAAAQLIARRTGPTIGCISAPGLIAAGVGVLTWQRLVRRRREHKSWVSRAREMAVLRQRPVSPS